MDLNRGVDFDDQNVVALGGCFSACGMLVPMLVGFFVPGYSSIHQHMSELELLSPTISMACRIGAIVSGLAIIGFAVVLVTKHGEKMPFTALASFIFGISMLSNGVFTTGSPLHGLYAIGLTVILCRAFFVAERGDRSDWISLLIAFLVLVYMWALMTGLDPAATRGLTQRLITIPMFAWFGYASLRILRARPFVRSL